LNVWPSVPVGPVVPTASVNTVVDGAATFVAVNFGLTAGAAFISGTAWGTMGTISITAATTSDTLLHSNRDKYMVFMVAQLRMSNPGNYECRNNCLPARLVDHLREGNLWATRVWEILHISRSMILCLDMARSRRHSHIPNTGVNILERNGEALKSETV
jgi:hypothetical protein